ncbi:MAG: alpha/beta hydrolase [Anaerolineae bacterium]
MNEKQINLAVAEHQTGATLFEPDASTGPAGGVILLHGGGADRSMCHLWAEALVAQGLCALSVDIDGHGQSTRPMTGLRDATQAVSAAADFLGGSAQVDAARLAVWGVSLGGSLAILAGARDKRLQVIVAAGAPYRLNDYDLTKMLVAPGFWQGVPALQEPRKDLLYALVECLDDRDVLAAISKIEVRTLLLVYGAHDLHVPLSDGQYLHGLAPQPVYLWVKWLEHLDLATNERVITGIAEWIAARLAQLENP